MKNSFFVLFFFCAINGNSQETIQITGRVTDGGEPLANVSILVQGTESGTFTDNLGRYSINTEPRKILIFSFMGLKTVEYITEDVNSVVNIEMYPEIRELDGVVVQKRRKSQNELEKEYATNKRIIKTGFGLIDQDRVGYSIRIVDGDKLSPAGIDFLGSLQSYVPGIRVFRQNGVSRADNRFGTDVTKPLVVLPRSFTSIQNPRPVAYEVDGQLMTDAPVEIPLANIERIAVISSLSALTKYGEIASGGLIIINTRGGIFDPGIRSSTTFDQARRWDNVFEIENLGNVDRIPRQKAIQELDQFQKLEEALSFIQEKDLLSSVSVYNQMEIAGILLNQWKDEVHYLEIMKGIAKKNADNAVILKSIAYQFEENGYPDEALELYKEILKIRPNYAQSYRDLANFYGEFGDTSKSIKYLSRYIRFVSMDTLSLPAEGIDSIIFTEYDHFLAQTDLARYDKRVSVPEDKGNIRLLFEWSHGDSEFELQFVNPEQHYFTWKHSLKDTPERIKDEKLKGYSSEHFFIDDSMPGKWQVNMNYLGNKSYDPSFLKLTVYYNYGTPFEKRETYVHKLTARNVNYQLFSFMNNPMLRSAAR